MVEVSDLLAVNAQGVAWQTKQENEAVSFTAVLFFTPAGMLLADHAQHFPPALFAA